jgi:hypothetical protein
MLKITNMDMTPGTLHMTVHYDELSTTCEMYVESPTGKFDTSYLYLRFPNNSFPLINTYRSML